MSKEGEIRVQINFNIAKVTDTRITLLSQTLGLQQGKVIDVAITLLFAAKQDQIKEFYRKAHGDLPKVAPDLKKFATELVSQA